MRQLNEIDKECLTEQFIGLLLETDRYYSFVNLLRESGKYSIDDKPKYIVEHFTTSCNPGNWVNFGGDWAGSDEGTDYWIRLENEVSELITSRISRSPACRSIW